MIGEIKSTTELPTASTNQGGDVKKTFKKGDPFLPIPKGEYLLKADRFEIKQSKAGNSYVNVSFKVVEGEHKGRLLWDTLMLSGSKKAIEIGTKKITELCAAVGKSASVELFLSDPELLGSLSNKEVIGRVDVTPEQNGYAAGNKIFGYSTL